MKAEVFERFENVITICCNNSDEMYSAQKLEVLGDKGGCIIEKKDFEINDNRHFFGEPEVMRIFLRDTGFENVVGNIHSILKYE